MRRVPFGIRLLPIVAAAVVLTACRGNVGGGSTAMPPDEIRSANARLAVHGIDKIDHVVIIVQENRSLNNLFYGFPGAKTVASGLDSKNQKIALKPIGLATDWDLTHNAQGFITACHGTGSIPGTDCKMNGFDKEGWTCGTPGKSACPIKYPPYSYVPHGETAPYFSMGEQYVLADQMYASNFDTSSFVSHQYIIAAQADKSVNYPTANWGCPGVKQGAKPPGPDWIYTTDAQRNLYGQKIPVCFDYTTLADELDSAGLSWAFYSGRLSPTHIGKPCGGSGGIGPDYQEVNGIWAAFQAVKHICYGSDWNKDVFTPQTPSFFTNLQSGDFRNVTWVMPTCENSDHPGCNSDTGPSWVASVVNAIGESKFWKSTAIFVFWDDYGGFYDPEPPAYLDYDGLGGRIPMLVISPYAKKGHVSHVHYEHGSILRFIEDRFGLATLSASDKRAVSPAQDCFDFNQKPRTFVPIKSKYDLNFFFHQPLDLRPPDTD
jgi:phospholipase C